jgi:fucose 4-O-acetylase-like acetyltransferase
MDEIHPAPTASRTSHWPLFLVGIGLFFLGPVIYVIQLRMKNLGAPWFLPILATAGATFMIASVWRRRGVVRTLAMLLFTLVCGLEWFMLLVAFRTPTYSGPARPGSKVPHFIAALADGKPFTDANLQSGSPSVLVFYRGHW